MIIYHYYEGSMIYFLHINVLNILFVFQSGEKVLVLKKKYREPEGGGGVLPPESVVRPKEYKPKPKRPAEPPSRPQPTPAETHVSTTAHLSHELPVREEREHTPERFSPEEGKKIRLGSPVGESETDGVAGSTLRLGSPVGESTTDDPSREGTPDSLPNAQPSADPLVSVVTIGNGGNLSVIQTRMYHFHLLL